VRLGDHLVQPIGVAGGGGGASSLADLSDVSAAANTENFFMATPNGSTGDYSGRAIVPADIPALAQSKITDLVSDLAGKADSSHSHTASDISDFDTEVGNNSDVAANTAARVDTSSAADGDTLVADGSGGVGSIKNNLNASAAPTTSDDSGDGYGVGSVWIDTTNDEAYICVDASAGSAVWINTTDVGGGGGSMSSFDLAADSGTAETVEDGNTATISGGTGIDTSVAPTDTVTVNIASGGVDTTQLADDAVTNAKVAANAVDTTQLADDAVTQAKLADGAVDTTLAATEATTLSTYDYVYLDSSNEWDQVDTDSITPKLGRVRGIVTSGAGSGTATAQLDGEVTNGGWSWTVGEPVYASTTAGGLTQTKPDPGIGSGQVAVCTVGIATSATTIQLTPETPVQYLNRVSQSNGGGTTITHHADPQGRGRRVSAYVATTDGTDVASYANSNQDEDVPLAQTDTTNIDVNATGDALRIGTTSGGDNTEVAQSFLTTGRGELTEFKITLQADDLSPTGTITYEVQTDSAGDPSGTAVGSSGTFTPTASSENTIDSSGNGIVLANNTTYWLVLVATDGDTFASSTGWRWETDSDSTTYADGTAKYNTGGGWIDSSQDASFEVTIDDRNDKLAQSFELSSGETVDKARLWLKKTGSPTGTMTLRIETDSAGDPSGTLADANATVTVAESSLGTSYGWAEFDFGTDFALSGSTTYWLVLSTDRSASDTNYVEWGADGSTPSYADGEMKNETNSAWSAESKDAVFEVLKQTTAYDEPCVIGRSSGGTRDVGVRFDDGAGNNANIKTRFTNHMGATADITYVVELE